MAKPKPDYSYDQIGKRLSGKGLTKHEKVLAQDDGERVGWIALAVGRLIEPGAYPTLIDIGASDGSIGAILAELYPTVTLYGIEIHPSHRDVLVNRNIYAWLSFMRADEAMRFLHLHPDGVDQPIVLCGELLEHLSEPDGRKLLTAIAEGSLIVTVPNRNCKSYKQAKRDRADYPDHKRDFSAKSLEAFLKSCGWVVPDGIQPIVGTLHDGIWLGAVCVRT